MFNLVRELYMKGIWNNYNLGLGFYAQIEGFFFLLWTLIHEIECFRTEKEKKRKKRKKKKEDLIKV